ncbi:MAG: hypothetical protein DRI94_01970 [Bacteroidetes bacterium]|nr:hypothetical protein [Bacteroidales bacterium]RLD52803.1 MAG: hypothetical protein DRI94_01970 [Bacteroidota bacterium]
MPEKNKINYIALIAGLLMIVISVLNYLMNDDFVSLGIFVFTGLGFLLIGIKSKFNEAKAIRINKYARTFFFAAIVMVLYWLAVAKFHLF